MLPNPLVPLVKNKDLCCLYSECLERPKHLYLSIKLNFFAAILKLKFDLCICFLLRCMTFDLNSVI